MAAPAALSACGLLSTVDGCTGVKCAAAVKSCAGWTMRALICCMLGASGHLRWLPDTSGMSAGMEWDCLPRSACRFVPCVSLKDAEIMLHTYATDASLFSSCSALHTHAQCHATHLNKHCATGLGTTTKSCCPREVRAKFHWPAFASMT